METTNLNFGEALKRLKEWKSVAREGWNWKGMWLVLIKAWNALYKNQEWSYPMQDCIWMKTATWDMQPWWLASQSDLLAEDWKEV